LASTASTLRGRHFLTLADFSADEITYLLDLAADLKAAKREGREERKLVGKNVALIFEKDSTRTRCAFEVAAYDQGAHVTFIGPAGSPACRCTTASPTSGTRRRSWRTS
jgi:ornithine carbamoyltransferase